AAILGERTELGGQRIEYLGQREVARADVEATALQLRDVEQASQQVFGGGQRTVQVLRGRDRLVAREAHLQRMREQLRGVQRLQQVVADRGEEVGLRLVRALRGVAGQRQRAGALGHALLQRLVDALQF